MMLSISVNQKDYLLLMNECIKVVLFEESLQKI